MNPQQPDSLVDSEHLDIAEPDDHFVHACRVKVHRDPPVLGSGQHRFWGIPRVQARILNTITPTSFAKSHQISGITEPSVCSHARPNMTPIRLVVRVVASDEQDRRCRGTLDDGRAGHRARSISSPLLEHRVIDRCQRTGSCFDCAPRLFLSNLWITVRASSITDVMAFWSDSWRFSLLVR